MVQRVLQLIRERSKIPLEAICVSGLVAVLSLRHIRSNQAAVPFELCGHVYANPPRDIYTLALTASLLTFCNSVFSVLRRCVLVWYRGDRENRTAHLVPCVGTDVHNNSCALYVRRWSTLTSLAFYFILPGFAIWFYGNQISQSFLPLRLITGYQALNMVLAIVMILIPRGTRSPVHKFIDLISVFATDKEYDAPDWEKELFPFEEVKDASSIRIAEIAHHARVVIDIGNGKSVCIRNDRNVGLKTNGSWPSWFGFPLVRMPVGKLAQIEKKHLNFRLIPLRIPYSIMWYSTYQGLGNIGGYRGAEEIDKCLIWLALVSVLAVGLISYIPGPCVVIKTIPTDEDESHDVV